MSASSKKKLRKEQNAAQMTEKQLTEQKEAKKLKIYTSIFVAALALMLVVAIVAGVSSYITASGMREKNTVGLTVGQHSINNVELNYHYIDAINNYYSTYGDYISLFGLDAAKPLNEQVIDESTGETWADYFLTSASENARAIYALSDAAEAEGFTLSETDAASVESTVSTMGLYAMMYGYSDADGYLKAMYGNGASEESYRAYLERSLLADAYYAAHADSLTYDDAALRAAEAENYNAYSSFTYSSYYLGTSKFLQGGTTGADGAVTYSDEEKAAAVAAAEEAAKALTSEEITSVEELDAAIAALSINEGTAAASTLCENYGYNNVNSVFADWVTSSDRKAGDLTYIASGTEEINGYYVVLFQGANENLYNLKNVRHILVAFEHNHEGTDAHGEEAYSQEELDAAKAEAEEILNQWKSGEATEDTFAALANEKSDDGDGTTGGLYEDVFKGQMVKAFEDWCFDEARTAGDTGIVQTEYGFHVMYFVGDSETSYRDYLITNELRAIDLESWYTGLCEAMTLTEGDTRYIRKDLVMSVG